MPTTRIANIGDVEYVSATLPAGIKGKSIIGGITDPIWITEDLGPSAKLDYVVAHEVGHRVTLDAIINAYKESPTIFELAPSPPSGFIRYLISLGLQKSHLRPLHPGTIRHLGEIFDQNARGEYTQDDIATEFIAEVYANWATNRGTIPEPIARRFRALTDSKNAIIAMNKSREAAFEVPVDKDQIWNGLAVLGLMLVAAFALDTVSK